MPLVSGKRGSITIGGNTYHVVDWTANIEIDQIDVTNTNSGGYREYISGLVGGTFSFTAVHNTTNTLVSQFAGLEVGAKGSGTFTIAGGGSISGTIVFESIEYSSSVDGRVESNGSGRFTGTITSA